jgi:SAM-dependent methyltransferase
MEIRQAELADVTRYIESHKQIAIEDMEPEFASMMWRLRRFKPVDTSTKMLEVGIGTGWFPIMCKMKGLSCKGMEISPQLVEYAKAFGRHCGIEADIELGNIEDADLGEGVYDIVVAASVFEHVEHWQDAIRGIYKALKPGGVLYFTSTNKFGLAETFCSHEYKFPFYGWLPDAWRYRLRRSRQGDEIMELGIDFNQFTYPQLRRCFEEVGFSTVLDMVEMFDPDHLNNPTMWKKTLLRALRRFKALKTIALVFAPGTSFVCIK